MPGTSTELLCKCCVNGITRYYRVTVSGLTNRECPNCPPSAAYVFDMSDPNSCSDSLLNTWCYTPVSLIIGSNDGCLASFEVNFAGPGSGVASEVVFELGSIEDCRESQTLPKVSHVGNYECNFPNTCQVDPIAPESLAELTESDCFQPQMCTCQTTANFPAFADYSSQFRTSADLCCAGTPQPAIPGVGGFGGDV